MLTTDPQGDHMTETPTAADLVALYDERVTLTEFLLARLDEDEAVAKQAAVWQYDASHYDAARRAEGARWYVQDLPRGQRVRKRYRDERVAEARTVESEHIARHDPARVLADVETKRRIVEWATDGDHARDLPFDEHYVLAALALPYADHPDYREEWRP